MEIKNTLYKLRTEAKMSRDEFAELFGVSRQSVQKWESGAVVPEISKIIEISKHFGISLDALIFNRDSRIVDDMKYDKYIKPHYSNLNDWEFYTSGIMIEYRQAIDEGLDVEMYKNIFESVSRLPKNEIKKNFGDILYKIIINAKEREDYKYTEPSGLEDIKTLRKPYPLKAIKTSHTLEKQIHGAWMGRICGCLLGQTIECILLKELIPILKDSGNYPMHRYIYRTDITDKMYKEYDFPLANRNYADEISGMPSDDDLNYVILAQLAIEKYGKDFSPYDMSRIWLDYQTKECYCTAERVAYCNFIKGYEPPYSAVWKNPYREWIGAQIRGDYFGYINPGNCEMAAEMAWRDASISHVKNGIYGEMFVAAMLAAAAVTVNITDIILAGLAQIPYTSRFYEAIMNVYNGFKSGISQKEFFDSLLKKYDENDKHDAVHTIPNAMIVVASLLYGKGDFGKSICMAVEAGFDTDCNGATVGSVLGMAYGIDAISEYWQKPIGDTLHTSVFGLETIKISDRVRLTMEHINKMQ